MYSREYIVSRLHQAVYHLDRALYLLERSETASIFDILTPFSFPFDFIEYGAFNQAMIEINLARQTLYEVYPYLRGYNVNIDIYDDALLWMFVDVVFDNIIVDLVRHFKIREIKKRVRKVRERIAEVISQLTKY